jgi:ArsR family transcriptional regulator
VRLKSINITYGEQFFKALADQTRIRILHLLFNNKELTISDIELILEFTQTKTARHMTYLKNSGLVSSRKHHQWVFYYIKDEAMDIVAQMFQFLKNDTTLKEDQKVVETLKSNRELSINKFEQKKWNP